MPEGYCELDDVRAALKEKNLQGQLQEPDVTPAIEGVSTAIRKESGRHWYDSTGTASDYVPTAPRSVTNVRLDIPSSPHAQDRQLFHGGSRVRYPVTVEGPYCRLRLPHGHVDTVDALKVRDRTGGVTDWTTTNDHVEGIGEDYYIREEDADRYGASYLYLRARSIGPRTDFQGLVTVDYSYGIDSDSEPWDDVRRGVALRAAAQLVRDDDTQVGIPDSGQLVSLESKAQAMERQAGNLLSPYLSTPVG